MSARIVLVVFLILCLTAGVTCRTLWLGKEELRDFEAMSDRNFFNAVNLDFPGLDKVKAAVNEGDFGKAKEELLAYYRVGKAKYELLAYYRNRTGPVMVEEKVPPENNPTATDTQGERVCAGYIKAIGDREALAGDKIDWFNFPATDPENRLQTSLVMTMNWHYSTEEVGKAYAVTSNHKYARKCIDLIKSWIIQAKPFPKEPPVGKSAPLWRTIHYVAPRLDRWMECFFWLIDCPAVTTDEKIAILKALLPQIDYMKNNEVTNMPNMLVAQLQTLIKYGTWFPEFKESKEWIKTGVTKLNRLLDDFIYPDHSYIELCYFGILKDWVDAVNLMKKNNIPVPENFEKKLENAFEFPMYMSKPNFKYPSVNDEYVVEDPEQFPPPADPQPSLLKVGAETFHRDDMKFVASYGREGKPPKFTSYPFPYGGFYVMRTDWTPQARYLVFDGGKNAGGHNHVDKLSFELYAYGNTLITDTGCGGEWASKWRSDYFVATPGQNTIMVDGKSQVANYPLFEIPSLMGNTPWRKITDKPLDNTWVSTENFDFVESAYTDGYAIRECAEIQKNNIDYEISRTDDPKRKQELEALRYPLIPPEKRVKVTHKRSILFVKPDYWIMSDFLTGEGKYKIESLLHLLPTSELEIAGKSITVKNGSAALLIHPVTQSNLDLKIVKGEMDPIQGWIPMQPWAGHKPSPCAIYTTEENLPVATITILYPYPRKSPADVKVTELEVKKKGKSLPRTNASGICIQNPQTNDYYLISHSDASEKEFGELIFDGKVALVREDSSGLIKTVVAIGARKLAKNNATIFEANRKLDWFEVKFEENKLSVNYQPTDADIKLFTQKAATFTVNGNKYESAPVNDIVHIKGISSRGK
jgi:hypothetical protein